MKRKSSIVESLPDWAHGLLAAFIAVSAAVIGSQL